MQTKRLALKKTLYILAAFLFALMLMLLLCLCAKKGVCDYPYNTYLLQAQAWLRGETALDYNREFLELAVFEDRYFVSFPPVPSVPMVLYTLIFGDEVPGGLFIKLYAAAICAVVFSEFMRTRRMPLRTSLVWSLLFCFGSALLPITMTGAVWYEAQILALLLTVSAVVLMLRDHPTASCLCYALSVGCRPFSVLLGPALLLIYLRGVKGDAPALKKRAVRLIPGILVGLCVAAGYGWYNFIRFGDVFEFGHNYLPEFTRSAYGQMSVHYLGDNLKTILFGSPIGEIGDGKLSFNAFGFSMFISCPVLICDAVWWVRDLILRRMTAVKWACVGAAALNVVMLCLHRTLGGHQFGLRYALELLPYCLIPLMTDKDRRGMENWEAALLFFGLVLNFIGGIAVHV